MVMSQVPHIPRIQESKAGGAEDLSGKGLLLVTGGTMAANRGVETFLSVFLLCCWQDVQPWPNRELSGRVPGDWQVENHRHESGRQCGSLLWFDSVPYCDHLQTHLFPANGTGLLFLMAEDSIMSTLSFSSLIPLL